MRVLVVSHHWELHDLRARGREGGRDHRPVGLVDLARLERALPAAGAPSRSPAPPPAAAAHRRPRPRRPPPTRRSAAIRGRRRARRSSLPRARHRRDPGCGARRGGLLNLDEPVGSVVRSTGTTASAPSGTVPPVAIAAAEPAGSEPASGPPAAIRPGRGAARRLRSRAPRIRPSPSSGTAEDRYAPRPARRRPCRPRRLRLTAPTGSERPASSTQLERLVDRQQVRYWHYGSRPGTTLGRVGSSPSSRSPRSSRRARRSSGRTSTRTPREDLPLGPDRRLRERGRLDALERRLHEQPPDLGREAPTADRDPVNAHHRDLGAACSRPTSSSQGPAYIPRTTRPCAPRSSRSCRPRDGRTPRAFRFRTACSARGCA